MPPPQRFAPQFEREQGCTEAEWLGWLPGAVRGHRWQLTGPGQARVDIGDGRLDLHWVELPPRRIALMSLPRLQVTYRFDGLDADGRSRFMQYFDLYMQRGGG
jgi:hypothetical protein